MFVPRALRLIFIVCLKIQLSKCLCEISPGNKNITDDPSRVFVVLNCSFPGSNFDAVLWTRNEQPVGQNEIYRDLQKNKKWSAVALTKIPNYEKYQCGMKRGEENCSVSPGKPKLRNLPLVKIVNQHYSSEIGDCRVDAGWPRPDVSWWRKGSQLHDNDQSYSIVINNYSSKLSQLKILAINGYQHGTYTCRADNIFGTSEQEVIVMIKRSDLIKWESGGANDPIVALEGTNITLECTCEKNECKEKTATDYWKFKDRNINQSDRIKLSKVTTNGGVKIIVTILNISGNDSGEYGCGINTSLGFGEETKRLYVLMKDSDTFPRVDATRKKVSADLHSPASLICSAKYPSILENPRTFWGFNESLRIKKGSQNYQQRDFKPRRGLNSTTSQTFQLHIANVSVVDYGWYSCGVEFKVGQTTVSLSTRLKLGNYKTGEDDVHGKRSGTVPEESPLIAISSITAGGIILGFVVAFLAYRLCRNKRRTEEPFFESPLNSHQFRYDVFVTFSSQDLNWVKKELIPLVEKHKLNYCIHDRDFEIGKPVVDNMAQSVYTSRKVLAVMSHNYMSSKFCRGELEMALYRSTEMGDSSVIVMRIDSVDRSKLPKALRNRTFLDYNDFTERKNWEDRLIRHLKPPPVAKCTEEISEKSYTLLKNAEM